MARILYDDNNKKVASAQKAIDALTAAYNDGGEATIAAALENAKATFEEVNRQKRSAAYKALKTDDITKTQQEIIKMGYIAQIKLVNRYNAKSGVREIRADGSEAAVDVTEVNRMVRTNIFNEDIDYVVSKFRNALIAYISTEMGKTLPVVEEFIGYEATKHLGTDSVSMNNLSKLLQNAIDTIVYVEKDGKNIYLAKKAYVKQISYWVATKSSKYGTKFSSTEFVRQCITDILWAIMNNKELEVKADDKIF